MTSMFLADDDATLELGQRLAPLLRAGDVIVLEGDLGAGKTALARAVIRALTGDERLDVPSPTFALVQPYETGNVPILHADLYRLAHPRDIDELGLLDRADAILLVEWAERSPELLARASGRVALSVPPGGQGRDASVSFADGRTP